MKADQIAEIVRKEVALSVPTVIRQVAVEKTEIFSGPIPAPSACKEYEEILPGFTDRALKIAENAQKDDTEARKRGDNYLLLYRGASLLVVFILAVAVIGASVYLLMQGKSLAGFGILLTGIVTMITAVVARKNEAKS